MAKKEKMIIYVVDFSNKKLVLKEEFSNSKKDSLKMEKVLLTIENLELSLKERTKLAS